MPSIGDNNWALPLIYPEYISLHTIRPTAAQKHMLQIECTLYCIALRIQSGDVPYRKIRSMRIQFTDTPSAIRAPSRQPMRLRVPRPHNASCKVMESTSVLTSTVINADPPTSVRQEPRDLQSNGQTKASLPTFHHFTPRRYAIWQKGGASWHQVEKEVSLSQMYHPVM